MINKAKYWTNKYKEIVLMSYYKNKKEPVIENGILTDIQKQKISSIIKQQAKNVHKLWELYTSDRDNLNKGLLNTKINAYSYLLGFHLPNFMKTYESLKRANSRFHLFDYIKKWEGEVQVNDLGCGTGAMSQALLARLPQLAHKKNVRFDLSDISGAALDLSRMMMNDYNKIVFTHKQAIEDIADNYLFANSKTSLNIYLLGYCVNELERNVKAKKKIENILNYHNKNNSKAIFIVVEPANQVFSRKIMQLHDSWINDYNLQSIYPCPSSTLCPMLAKSRDWCFSEFQWTHMPAEIKLLDRLTELNHELLTTTTMIFASESCAIDVRKKDNKIVVGRPTKLNSRGTKVTNKKYDTLICSGSEIIKVTDAQKKFLRGEVYQTIDTSSPDIS